MKIDSFIQMVNNIRKGQLTNDTDPQNTTIQMYTSPYDTLTQTESVRFWNPSPTCVWGDGKTYTAYDAQGAKWSAPSCGWLYGAGGRWS
jgi:hypothetical protein